MRPFGPRYSARQPGDAIDMFLEAERDDFEEDTNLFRKSYDVRAWYRET